MKYLLQHISLKGTTVYNPYCISTHQSTLAPWMGRHTRLGNILPKTEIRKALKKKLDNITHSTRHINKDIILELIESKKVEYIFHCQCSTTKLIFVYYIVYLDIIQHNKKDLQDACLSLGVSSDESIADLMNRLQELLKFKNVCPKLFLKLQKAGGEYLLCYVLVCYEC